LKIAVNGTFGKQGNMYSTIYAPKLLIQTTVTGQLGLLLLIEACELANFEVVSANTDGFVTKIPKVRRAEFDAIVRAWEAATGFETEATKYAALYSRDVNNYIAVKDGGSCKAKGTYSERGSALNSALSKNPEALICSDAVQAFLSNGTPIEQTINECCDDSPLRRRSQRSRRRA
jgi:DNA polymerase elongation subunit (family B)